MKKKFLIIVLLTGGLFLSGCSMGNPSGLQKSPCASTKSLLKDSLYAKEA